MSTTERMVYGGVPYQPRSETSRAAADSVEPRVGTYEWRVLDWLRKHGPATDEEIRIHTGLKESTQRPRRVRLVEKRLVKAVGTKTTSTGRKANLWAVCEGPAQGLLSLDSGSV